MEDEETKHAITNLAVKVDKKIDENPLAYIAGAFIGGAIVGYVMSRGK